MRAPVGRIGVIYPSDGLLDGEFWRCVPPGVSVHITRTQDNLNSDPKLSATQQALMMAEGTAIEDAAGTFYLIEPGCVTYACTAASFVRGVGYDVEIIDRIEAASGSPGSTTSTAVVAALRGLGVRKLAVAAPYGDEICDRLRRFFEESGLEIVNLANMRLAGVSIGAVPIEQVYELAKESDTPEAEALFISCTGFRTVDILEALEQELGKPVVSSNQATMWHALCISGIDARLEGVGCLFRA